jgi:uncharacterized protein YcfJ
MRSASASTSDIALGDEEGKMRMDRDPGERIPVRDGKLDLDAPDPGETRG